MATTNRRRTESDQVGADLPEPTEEELQADMRTVSKAAHSVPEESRRIETTREAGEYMLPPTAKAKE